MIYGECATIKENILYTFHVCRCSRALDVNFQLNVLRLLVRFVDSQKSSLFFTDRGGNAYRSQKEGNRPSSRQGEKSRRRIKNVSFTHCSAAAEDFAIYRRNLWANEEKKLNELGRQTRTC